MEIYAITDAGDSIRYVGQSWSAAKRQREHWQGRFRLETRLAQWLRTLDKPPAWRVLAIIEDVAANRTERAIITAARIAFPCLNLNVRTRGGWGPELRARLSAARMGRVFSDETRAKISAAQRGKKVSPEFVARARELQKARWADPEYRERHLAALRSEGSRAKRRAAVTGKTQSDETRRRISQTRQAQWKDPDYRDKTLAAQRASAKKREISDETRAKLSASTKASWDKRRGGPKPTPPIPSEANERRRESARQQWADPARRAEMIAAMKESRERRNTAAPG